MGVRNAAGDVVGQWTFRVVAARAQEPGRGNGTAVVVLPGGEFAKVVFDSEGTEPSDGCAASGLLPSR